MAQPGKDGGLAMKLAGVLLGGEQVFLDGDGDAEVDVRGPVDRAHTALTEHGLNAIAMMQDRSWRDRHPTPATAQMRSRFIVAQASSILQRRRCEPAGL